MKFVLIVLIAGQMLGSDDDWWLFETKADCLRAANLAANTVRDVGDVDATCYEWTGQRGEAIGGYGMSCNSGLTWNAEAHKCVPTR